MSNSVFPVTPQHFFNLFSVLFCYESHSPRTARRLLSCGPHQTTAAAAAASHRFPLTPSKRAPAAFAFGESCSRLWRLMVDWKAFLFYAVWDMSSADAGRS
jgi:hypothetical protein